MNRDQISDTKRKFKIESSSSTAQKKLLDFGEGDWSSCEGGGGGGPLNSNLFKFAKDENEDGSTSRAAAEGKHTKAGNDFFGFDSSDYIMFPRFTRQHNLPQE
jgi:hypothetical protein